MQCRTLVYWGRENYQQHGESRVMDAAILPEDIGYTHYILIAGRKGKT